jgi:hypothetical protein
MSVTNGRLEVLPGLPNGLLASQISGSGTDRVTLQATPDRINATLTAVNGFVFRPNAGFTGDAVLTIEANDQGATGAGGVGTDAMTITIDVAAVNDPPAITLPGTQTTNEDVAFGIFGIRVTDPDSGNQPIVVTLQVPRGVLTVAAGVTGGASIANNGSGLVTLTGSVDQINATLADPTGVRYEPLADDNGTVVLTITADDQGHTGSGGPKVAVQTLTINITAVNDAPVVTLPGAQTVAENMDLVFSQGSGNAVSVFDVEATPNNLNVWLELNVQHGTLMVGTGVAGGVTAGNIVGNGTGALILTGTPAQINATLAAGLTYRGLQNFNGTDTLTAEVNDQGNSGVGGPLTGTGSVTIAVTFVNNPPVANPDTFTIAEDSALTVTADTLTANDLPGPPAPDGTADDESDQTVRVVSVDAVSQRGGSITFDPASGAIVYTPLANFNGTDTFTYTIDDGDPASTARGTVTINVTAVNDPPIANSVAFTTDEDVMLTLTPVQLIGNDLKGPAAPAGTLDDESGQVLTLVSVDAQSQRGGTITFIGGQVRYTPPANGNQLNFPGDGFDRFTYRVADNGLTNGVLDPRDAVGTVTITVLAVNDPPVITAPASATVDEDVPQAIAGIAITDIDAGEGATAGNLTVTFAVSQGTVTVNTTVPGGIGGVLNNGTGLVTVSATPAQLAATLSHASGLVYLSNLNFNGTDQLVINANDAGQTGKGGVHGQPDGDDHRAGHQRSAGADAEHDDAKRHRRHPVDPGRDERGGCGCGHWQAAGAAVRPTRAFDRQHDGGRRRAGQRCDEQRQPRRDHAGHPVRAEHHVEHGPRRDLRARPGLLRAGHRGRHAGRPGAHRVAGTAGGPRTVDDLDRQRERSAGGEQRSLAGFAAV